MSIQSESRKAGPYLGDGAQTLFPFDFKIFKADELLVVYTDLNSIERTLVLNTDYTVSLNADQDAAPGGSIHTTFAPLAGYRVTMTSKVPNLQEMVLTNNGGFYPVLLNKAFDKLTILVQQLREEVSRAVKVTLSTDKTPDQLLDSIFASALQAAEAEAQAQAAAQSAQGFVEDIAILIGKIYVRATGLVPIPVAWRGRNARVHLIGGGGGGGGGASGAANAGGGGGGGGGAGAWVSSEIVLPEGAANLYAEIGLGGAGGRGALTNENAAANGASGLATTLYSRLDEPRIVLATAAGGAAGGCGGGSNRPGRIYPGAAGGNGGGGGAGAYSGTEAFGVPGNGGVGGTSCYGAGGRSGFRAGQSGSPGADGESALANTGAGGGGGGGGIQESLGISGGGSGGAGGSGLIIIELR